TRVIPVLLIVIYFIILLISLSWTENKSEGFDHLGRSIVLLIIPLVLGLGSNHVYTKQNFNTLLRSFVFGVLVSTIVLWAFAFLYSFSFEGGTVSFDSSVDKWDSIFFYSNFSFMIHPTYFGMMLLMAAWIVLNQIKKGNIFSKSIFWPILMSGYLLSLLYLISSRAMMLAGIFLLVWFAVNWIPNRKNLGLLLLISVGLLTGIAVMHPRLQYVINRFRISESELSYEMIENLNERGQIWHASYLLIKHKPIYGYGIGDVKDTLIGMYDELEFFEEEGDYLNCHNQFLETWIAVGFIGVILLIILLFYPLLNRKVADNPHYIGFLIICLTAFLFESILNRLWGIAFFALFYTLFAMAIPQKT
ncbi:hypothetical protein LCGC14_2904070, partial [marine sediment metagenome]